MTSKQLYYSNTMPSQFIRCFKYSLERTQTPQGIPSPSRFFFLIDVASRRFPASRRCLIAASRAVL